MFFTKEEKKKLHVVPKMWYKGICINAHFLFYKYGTAQQIHLAIALRHCHPRSADLTVYDFFLVWVYKDWVGVCVSPANNNDRTAELLMNSCCIGNSRYDRWSVRTRIWTPNTHMPSIWKGHIDQLLVYRYGYIRHSYQYIFGSSASRTPLIELWQDRDAIHWLGTLSKVIFGDSHFPRVIVLLIA